MSKLLKILFFLSILAVFTEKGGAQGFNASLVLGFNASQITGDSLAGFNKSGLLAGASIKRVFRRSKKVSAQLDFLYSRKGSRSKIDTSSSGPPKPFFKLTLTYVELPLILNYDVYDWLRLQAGAYTGILTGATFDDGNQTYERTNSFFTRDYGYLTGFEAIIVEDKLALSFRATNSLINFSRVPPNYYNVVTSFSLRYTIR